MTDIKTGMIQRVDPDRSSKVRIDRKKRNITVDNTPPWLRIGDRIHYSTYHSGGFRGETRGEYVPAIRTGEILSATDDRYVVAPEKGKYVRVIRPRPWFKKGDIIPFETINKNEGNKLDVAVLADKTKATNSSIVSIVSLTIPKGMQLPPANFAIIGYGNLFNTFRWGIEEYFSDENREGNHISNVRDDQKIRFQWGFHSNQGFVHQMLQEIIEDYNITQQQGEYHFAEFNEVPLEYEDQQVLNAFKSEAKALKELLRIYAEQRMHNALINV